MVAMLCHSMACSQAYLVIESMIRVIINLRLEIWNSTIGGLPCQQQFDNITNSFEIVMLKDRTCFVGHVAGK